MELPCSTLAVLHGSLLTSTTTWGNRSHGVGLGFFGSNKITGGRAAIDGIYGATNASVEGAVRQAADLGYETYVLSDAASAAHETAHQASGSSLTMFARIITLPGSKASLLTVADKT